MKKNIALAFIILAVLVIALKFSPTFSKYGNYETLYNIKDEGIKLAIKNNFIQDVNISDEYDDLVFTVDDLIFDGKRMIIFYTIENKGDHKYIQDFDFDILDDKGKSIPASYGYPNYYNINLNEVKKIHDKFDLLLSPEVEDIDSIQVKIKMQESEISKESQTKIEEGTPNEKEYAKPKELPYTWNIAIPVDKNLFKNEKLTYDLNETVEIEGQKLCFDSLTIYPITSVLHLRYDVNNTMNIFSVEDLKIVDNNREWTNGVGGLMSSFPDDFTRYLYFESNYFDNPDSIHIMGSGINAIDKEKMDVIVDIEKGKLLKSPDEYLKLLEIENRYNSDSFSLGFEYPDEEGLSFRLSFKDAENNNLRIRSAGSSSGENYSRFYLYIPNDLDYVNPITLTLSNYPNIIDKPFKIKVK